MHPELTNLLPRARARQLYRQYFVRLGTLTLLMLSVIVIIHGVFLLPSYLYLSQEVTTKQSQLDTAEAKLAGSKQQAVTSQLASLKDSANYLSRLAALPRASDAARAILGVPRTGIALTGITVTPGKASGAPTSVALSGTAKTREDLRAYDLALGSAAGVKNVDLPVSAYANESDISFTLTVTGTFTP